MPKCAECFEALNATPILDQGHIVFVTESVFMNPDDDHHWSPDKGFADALRDAAKSKTNALTGIIEAGDISQEGLYKGKRYIGLTNWGLKETLDHFSVTLVHALIHSGGVKGHTQTRPHDLAYLGRKYVDAIKACQTNEPRIKTPV